MKHISESIIGRKGISTWPNPYSLTKKDAKGHVEGWPLEVITLALLEAKRNIKSYTIKNLQDSGVSCMFSWGGTCDGRKFWSEIVTKNFDMFYARYTPETLKERLENETY